MRTLDPELTFKFVPMDGRNAQLAVVPRRRGEGIKLPERTVLSGPEEIGGVGEGARMAENDAFSGAVVEPRKNVPLLVEAGIDKKFTGRVMVQPV